MSAKHRQTWRRLGSPFGCAKGKLNSLLQGCLSPPLFIIPETVQAGPVDALQREASNDSNSGWFVTV